MTACFVYNRFICIGSSFVSLDLTTSCITFMIIWIFSTRSFKIFDGIKTSHLTEFKIFQSKFTLKPYTFKWNDEFLAEKTRTNAILLPKWKHILNSELSPDGFEHIGSTAIPKIALAKPQHDCALAIDCSKLPKDFVNDLSKLGYRYVGTTSHSHCFFFVPNEHERATLGEGYILYVVTPKAHDWLRSSEILCEYLKNSSIAREKYATLIALTSHTENHFGKFNIVIIRIINVVFF